MARVVRFHRHGGPEVLQIEDAVVPPPGTGEVQIRVKALGLNRAEALMRAGTYIESPTLPAGLGLEASGVVEQIGLDVTGIAPGDAVSVVPPISMARYPAYGELASFPARHIVKHPASLDWAHAAALWMPYLTAYGALIGAARLQAGDYVVVTAASSSVGLAAIQIARRVGATAIAVTRTSTKKSALLAAGAPYVVVSQEEDLKARIMSICGSGGARVVLDAVGGPIFEPLTAAMSHYGILVEYGGLDTAATPFPLSQVLGKCLTLRGYLVHEVIQDPVRLAAAKDFIASGVACGELQPIIDRIFAFEDIIQAHRYLESNRQFGKIVVML